MRNEWSLTLSGERTPRFTQPARGMLLRRSKVWRNGRDGPYRRWQSWTSMNPDFMYPTKKGVELGILSSLGRNFPPNDYVIAPAGPPEDSPFGTEIPKKPGLSAKRRRDVVPKGTYLVAPPSHFSHGVSCVHVSKPFRQLYLQFLPPHLVPCQWLLSQKSLRESLLTLTGCINTVLTRQNWSRVARVAFTKDLTWLILALGAFWRPHAAPTCRSLLRTFTVGKGNSILLYFIYQYVASVDELRDWRFLGTGPTVVTKAIPQQSCADSQISHSPAGLVNFSQATPTTTSSNRSTSPLSPSIATQSSSSPPILLQAQDADPINKRTHNGPQSTVEDSTDDEDLALPHSETSQTDYNRGSTQLELHHAVPSLTFRVDES